MLTNTKHRVTTTMTGVHNCAPVVPAKAKQIAADKIDKAFWINIMRQRTAKGPETRDSVAPLLMRELEKAGRRLERDPGDNYALALVTSMILNKVYFAAKLGDDHYKKYFPRDKKTGEQKEIRFTSEHFCRREREDCVPVYMTDEGAVRSLIHTCGKAWTCSICGAKIATRRNLEVHKILHKARSEKMTVFMLTLTTPHYINQPLLLLSKRNQEAYLHMFNSGTIKKMKKFYNWFGTIKTMETNMGGKNGWHNHFHVVLIFDKKIYENDEMIIKATFKQQWEISCKKYGLIDGSDEETDEDFANHSVDLKRDFDPDYIAKQSEEWKKEHRVSEKWGAAEELTHGKLKKGWGSCTAFGFVARMARLAALGCYTIADMEQDAELFIEYACAMHGRSMIQFSKGLRKWAGLDEEKTDKEICDEQENHGSLIGGFDKEQHAFIRSHALWRPFKKLLMADIDAAIKTVNEIFEANGLRPFYSIEEIIDFICAFTEPDELQNTPPTKIGEVCPKKALTSEQLFLFGSNASTHYKD